MTERDDGRLSDIDEARQAAEASQRQAEEDMRRAREQAHKSLTLAGRLRRLREANGFSSLLDDAFGGGHA
ncbi:DUF7620 family protein [Nonomuraea sp. NPDC002799]